MELLETTLRFCACRDADWLYDCHAQKFARVEHGACMASGFVPLFLGQLFGVPVARWPETMGRVQRELRALPLEQRAERLAGLRPKKSLAAAAEIALLTYPGAERFIARAGGHLAPFQLRPDALMQPNVMLNRLEARAEDGWHTIAEDLDQSSGRRAVRDRLLAAARAGESRGSARATPAPPGCYVVGHSGLLIRGRRSALLIDPVPLTGVAARSGGYGPSALREMSDTVAITHGHFDHYHLPSLLCFADRPLLVPVVPRASIVCEDLAGRLEELGADRVVATAWGSVTELDDLRVHTLPFVGEQFLTAECHPEARSWGNCYVVETEDARVLVAADCGFEPDRSIFDVVAPWVAANGPIDVVAAQALGLPVAFGQGDPDLQITALTCAHRAEEAFELLDPDRRVTLAASDIPRLVEVCGAKSVVLYGAFQFSPGRPAVAESLTESVRAHLATSGQDATVADLRIGEGVAFGSHAVVPLRG